MAEFYRRLFSKGKSALKQGHDTDPKDKQTKKTKEEMEQLVSSGVKSETPVGRGGSGSIYKDPDSGKFYSGDTRFGYGEEMKSDTIRNPFDESLYEVKWSKK
jgi:hypothetical protein